MNDPLIRIYSCPQDESMSIIEQYTSTFVPRVGDHICIQYWTAEVFKVEITIIKGRPNVSVFCDTQDIVGKIKKSIPKESK